MIEEINKLQDIIDKGRSIGTIDDEIGKELLKVSIEILDKYNNQPDYKNVWEELKEDCREVEKANDYILYERLQQLEQKYGIGE